jgi:hypothetical protein
VEERDAEDQEEAEAVVRLVFGWVERSHASRVRICPFPGPSAWCRAVATVFGSVSSVRATSIRSTVAPGALRGVT